MPHPGKATVAKSRFSIVSGAPKAPQRKATVASKRELFCRSSNEDYLENKRLDRLHDSFSED